MSQKARSAILLCCLFCLLQGCGTMSDAASGQVSGERQLFVIVRGDRSALNRFTQSLGDKAQKFCKTFTPEQEGEDRKQSDSADGVKGLAYVCVFSQPNVADDPLPQFVQAYEAAIFGGETPLMMTFTRVPAPTANSDCANMMCPGDTSYRLWHTLPHPCQRRCL